jgi:hypothetical protein
LSVQVFPDSKPWWAIDNLQVFEMPHTPKRAMVWKESDKAVGCNRCAWAYATEKKNQGAASLQKAFEEHVCEKYPPASGSHEDA